MDLREALTERALAEENVYPMSFWGKRCGQRGHTSLPLTHGFHYKGASAQSTQPYFFR